MEKVLESIFASVKRRWVLSPATLSSIFAILFGLLRFENEDFAAHAGSVAVFRSRSDDIILLLTEDCLPDDGGPADVFRRGGIIRPERGKTGRTH